MSKEIKECEICGRTEDQNELTYQDEQKGFHQSDVELSYCRRCGSCVCGFCSGLGVCCD